MGKKKTDTSKKTTKVSKKSSKNTSKKPKEKKDEIIDAKLAFQMTATTIEGKFKNSFMAWLYADWVEFVVVGWGWIQLLGEKGFQKEE